ncbi:MAG: hypothetical protein LC754_04865 [Acidobacteria bacterium]|nr:hypothetical protein [Acidobacteriota bacterium]
MKERRNAKSGKRAAQQTEREQGACGFEPNAFYERLLEMREENPSAFNTMSAATRLSVEAYIKAKLNFTGAKANKIAA